MKKISIVTPCYNEEENISILYKEVKRQFSNLPQYEYEHIFIDNSSTDNTVGVLKEFAKTDKNLKINSRQFLEISAEVFVDWFPSLSSVGFQAVWAGYYVEPRMILDPENGLFLGLRGQGFMLGQYLAKMYVDKIIGNPVPTYFDRLTLKGDGLLEKAFK